MLTLWNCENDCSGWQECWNYATGRPEEPLATFLRRPSDTCPFCGGEVYSEDSELEENECLRRGSRQRDFSDQELWDMIDEL